MIKVERAWDVREGHIEPKSRAGRRTVPIPVVLRDYLVEHKQRTSGAVTSSRARVYTFLIGHTWDIYGQLAVYLRLSGGVPPASQRP